MTLNFKIEWFRDDDNPSQAGMFVHTQLDMPCYQSLITKEAYAALAASAKCDFVTGLFAIDGVVEVSVKAYRVYVIKAELYDWDTIATLVIGHIGYNLNETTYNELPGSRLQLEKKIARREL